MRPALGYLLLDAFDPDTGELGLRVALRPGSGGAMELLRVKLHLGRAGEPLEPLRRELRTHAQTSLPPLWEQGLRTIVHALEAELESPGGRNPLRHLWVQTQVLHPADMARSTPNHPVPQQVEILRDWSLRLAQEGEALRSAEFLERLLMLAPKDRGALARLTEALRDQGMVEEMVAVAERWRAEEPERAESALRLGEGLLALGRMDEARTQFQAILAKDPHHALAHLGMGQALGALGGDPFPHLDAAFELLREGTASALRETFDFRLQHPPAGERTYELEHLPILLGVSSAEVQVFLGEGGLPATGGDGTVRESELARWVGVQNRYRLLPVGLSWAAPTPHKLPELS
ncbi:MAG: tetratricopeptide repeat protein [Acidobacteria bacterium]|nr:tetratricopeptide repeat protein [Acidobacteriota bacterium]